MEQNLEPKIENKTNKKKVITILGAVAVVLLVAAAAFIGGRLLNKQQSSMGLLSLGGEGNVVSMAFEMIPAPELPTIAPEVTGTFVERKDNTIYVQTFSMEMGGGGVVVSSSVEGSSSGPSTDMVISNANTGPKVEVVVTNDTLIYTDVTPMTMNPGEGTTKVQQVVERSNLDDITTQTMITVWGRKVGDRVIAEVIAYSNPIMIKAP